MSIRFHRALLTAALSLSMSVGFSDHAFASHSWGNYHWARTSNPFTLKLGNNVSTNWAFYLGVASNEWSKSIALDTEIVSGGTRAKTCKPIRGRVEVCSERYGNNGWLGIAQIWISGSHITQGAVKLNDTYFNTSKYNTPAWRNLVMCQEVGHTFGLDHQDEGFDGENLGTCMDYTNDPDGPPSNEYPNPHDYQQLETIYAHGDSTTTVGQTVQSGPGNAKLPPALTDPDSDEPIQLGTAQWGRLVRSTNHGRTELYELDLGRGQKLLTHIIWADSEDEPREGRGPR